MTPSVAEAGRLDSIVERRLTALGVALVRWDGCEQTASTKHRTSPCIFLVDAGAPPPTTWDNLADWVRLPVEADELLARGESLAARAAAVGLPGVVLDGDGVLHADGRSIPLSELQVRLLTPLMECVDMMVDRRRLIALTWPDGPPTDARAIDNRVKLLRSRLRDVPIRIHAIRGRGFVLQHGEGSS